MGKGATEELKRAIWPKRRLPRDVTNLLARKNACYVLIACGEPAEDGKMQVEMTFEGDECLAAYLIESAQDFIGSADHETAFS